MAYEIIFDKPVFKVSEAITRTLQNLNTDTESLQTPFSENDLANMFANFNMGEGGTGGQVLYHFIFQYIYKNWFMIVSSYKLAECDAYTPFYIFI